MKLQFLGAGHGIPTVDRFCSCAMLTCGGKHYLIDAGAPVADLLIRNGVNMADLRAVFITHRHGDHTAGLPHLLDLCNWCFKNADFDVYLTEQKTIDALYGIVLARLDDFDTARLRLHTYTAGEIYRDENITVTAIATDHMEGKYPSFAFMVEGDGQRLFFTGDLHSNQPVDFPVLAKELPSTAIVTEMAHFRWTALLPHIEAVKAAQVLVNHYNDTWSLESIDALAKAVDVPVQKVCDGDVFEW